MATSGPSLSRSVTILTIEDENRVGEEQCGALRLEPRGFPREYTGILRDAALLRSAVSISAQPVFFGGRISMHRPKPNGGTPFLAARKPQSELTKHLTLPEAYLALGETPEERQAKYRSLCDQYLRESGLLNDTPAIEMEASFIGNSVWRQLRQSKVGESFKARAGPP